MAGKKISQLTGSLSPSLSGIIPIVLSGTTYSTTLNSLRQVLVDSGSHNFTGSQFINGSLTVNGSITAREYILSSSITNMVIETVSGSSNFGNSLDDRHIFTGSLFISGNMISTNGISSVYMDVTDRGHIKYLSVGTVGFPHTEGPEALRVESSGSYNIAHFTGNDQYYTQINLQNTNSGSNASGDIVITADNGTEGVHFVDLGINSSTYTGGLVGRENDAYLLNIGKDLYIGTVGGTEHPSELKLFAQNSWENPQITIHETNKISFNTGSVSEGYNFEFSGSARLQNDVNIDGELTIGSVSEKIVLEISGGTSQYEFDYRSGSVFYLTSSLSNNSYNVSNAPTEEQRAVSITFVIKQETTPYIASSYKLNNENVTVRWANNEIPVGNSNKTDVIGLTALRVGSSWNVLGTFTTFG
jgi:hypothetical protein